MQREGEEVHFETDEARGGTTNHGVRWVLLISLAGAIVLLSAIWIFGAASHQEEEASKTPISAAAETVAEDATGNVDGVLLDQPTEAAAPSEKPELSDGLEVIQN